MNKMKTRFLAFAALALTLAACNNDNENLNDGPVAAQFTADIYKAVSTRVNPEGTDWTDGDCIGITGAGYTNVPYKRGNGQFVPDGAVIYYKDPQTKTFNAYYPYQAEGGTVTVSTTADKQGSGIDFLFATGAEGSNDNPTVSFTDKTDEGGEDNSFHHRMSRITLTFKAGDGVDFSMGKPESYTLGGLILTGTFNTADGIATADDGAQAGELAIELTDGNLTSSVILFPQAAASLPLAVNYNGEEYNATLTVPEGALQAGNNYTYTVKVRNRGLEVSEATIAPWNEIDGGEVDADL